MNHPKTVASQRTRILLLLQEAGELGVTNAELNSVCFRYAARVFELRRDGHRIETVEVKRGLFKFVLSSPQPNRSVGEAKRDMTPPTERDLFAEAREKFFGERSANDYRYQCSLEFASGCSDA